MVAFLPRYFPRPRTVKGKKGEPMLLVYQKSESSSTQVHHVPCPTILRTTTLLQFLFLPPSDMSVVSSDSPLARTCHVARITNPDRASVVHQTFVRRIMTHTETLQREKWVCTGNVRGSKSIQQKNRKSAGWKELGLLVASSLVIASSTGSTEVRGSLNTSSPSSPSRDISSKLNLSSES